MDVERQVAYWQNGSEEDIEAAEILLEKGKLRHGLFFAHLAIEKMLKAHVARATKAIPDRIHNLARLAEKARLSLPPEQSDFLNRFDIYQAEGRYPDVIRMHISKAEADKLLLAVREMLQWLTRQF